MPKQYLYLYYFNYIRSHPNIIITKLKIILIQKQKCSKYFFATLL